MYEIKKVSQEVFKEIEDFLLEVPAINNVDEAVLNNASVLFLDDKVTGIISFESFYNYALIRYFVFKRNTDVMAIKELFESIEDSIKDSEIEYVISLVNQDEIYDLFLSFGFNETDKNDVFLEEQNIEKTKFKDSKLMIKKIHNYI